MFVTVSSLDVMEESSALATQAELQCVLPVSHTSTSVPDLTPSSMDVENLSSLLDRAEIRAC